MLRSQFAKVVFVLNLTTKTSEDIRCDDAI